MLNEPLIANQERFKQLNNDQIAVLQQRLADYNEQVTAYTQAIIEANQNIMLTKEDILKVEASNLGIDQTIAILQEE